MPTDEHTITRSNPFHRGCADDEGLVLSRLIFDGKFAHKHAHVVNEDLFVLRVTQADLRRHGAVSGGRSHLPSQRPLEMWERAFGEGGSLATAIRRAKVLVVSEEDRPVKGRCHD